MTDLTIVIPTQGRHTLPRCLDSLRPDLQGAAPVEILVVADTHSPMLSDVRGATASLSRWRPAPR